MSDRPLDPRWFHFVAELLYPGALGMALVVFVDAVTEWNEWSDGTILWGMGFALWFTVYHCLLFTRLIERWETTKQYTRAGLISDSLDSIAMIVGFVALDLKSGPPPLNRMAWAYIAAMIVPLSAVFARQATWPWHRVGLIVVAWAAGLAGAWLNTHPTLAGATFEPALGPWNAGLLAVLWAALLVYYFSLYQKQN